MAFVLWRGCGVASDRSQASLAVAPAARAAPNSHVASLASLQQCTSYLHIHNAYYHKHYPESLALEHSAFAYTNAHPANRTLSSQVIHTPHKHISPSSKQPTPAQTLAYDPLLLYAPCLPTQTTHPSSTRRTKTLAAPNSKAALERRATAPRV
jgi:hypothetical protein